MKCVDMTALLHGRLDGELDLVNSLRFEEHLQTCPPCGEAYREQQRLRAVLRKCPRERAGDQVRRRVQAGIAASAGPRPARTGWWDAGIAKRAWATGAAMAIAAALVLVVAPPLGQDNLAREVISSHVRSRLADHLTDVATSDQHTVKPWLSAKLDFSPPVVDLAAAGFPLVGGRLDYLRDRTVAAVVYRRQQHVINLFVWPTPEGADTPAETLSQDGFNICHWRRAGMTFWAVSDVSPGALEEFEQLFRTEAKASSRG
jgi:anti-sigma factor RsiW